MFKSIEPFYLDYQATACGKKDLDELMDMMERRGWKLRFKIPSVKDPDTILLLFYRILLKVD
jgi:hypothetical protein